VRIGFRDIRQNAVCFHKSSHSIRSDDANYGNLCNQPGPNGLGFVGSLVIDLLVSSLGLARVGLIATPLVEDLAASGTDYDILSTCMEGISGN
jgi:hypothetical protein